LAEQSTIAQDMLTAQAEVMPGRLVKIGSLLLTVCHKDLSLVH